MAPLNKTDLPDNFPTHINDFTDQQMKVVKWKDFDEKGYYDGPRVSTTQPLLATVGGGSGAPKSATPAAAVHEEAAAPPSPSIVEEAPPAPALVEELVSKIARFNIATKRMEAPVEMTFTKPGDELECNAADEAVKFLLATRHRAFVPEKINLLAIKKQQVRVKNVRKSLLEVLQTDTNGHIACIFSAKWWDLKTGEWRGTCRPEDLAK
jgi:hypothetical protein